MKKAVWLFLIFVPVAHAADSDTPYMDELKKGMAPAPESSEGYSEREKRKLEKKDAENGVARPSHSYIDELRKTDPKAGDPADKESYTESEKKRLGPDDGSSTIAKAKAGKDDLHERKIGNITGGAGFKVGTGGTRTTVATGDAAARSYADVYGNGWIPDIEAFFEYQPFHSEFWGNFGLMVSGGLTYVSGSGKFKFPPLMPIATGSPASTATFGSDAQTQFRFLTAPIGVGLNYRFNLAHYVRPYVQVLPTVILYEELRNDDQGAHRGHAQGMTYGGGLNFLLDDVFKSVTWDLYSEFRIQHYYLTVDYSRLTTATGEVDFTNSMVSVGFMYEF